MEADIFTTWANYEYFDPRDVLVELRHLELELAGSVVADPVRDLITNKLQEYRERREAALLALGIGECVLATDVRFSMHRDSDYDSIFYWRDDDTHRFAPIQMKELVPEEVNPKQDLQSLVDGLGEYDSDYLIGAIHLNRGGSFDFGQLQLSDVKLAQLWAFGAANPEQTKFILIGDLLSEVQIYGFDYPTAY